MTIKLRPLTNRSDDAGKFQLPEDGFYQIAPYGNFPITLETGEKIVQVVDRAASDHLVANFANRELKDDMLIDYEHFSWDKDKESRAAGWIEELQGRDDGLYARIRWSNRGRADVEGGEYRYASPVFDRETAEDLGGGRKRVRTLLNAALTNDHNLKGMKPLSNRNGGNEPQTEEQPLMKDKLASLLGLDAAASDDAYVDKIKELKNRAGAADTAESELATLKQTQLEADVDKDLAEFEGVIENRDEIKKQLLANREGTRAVLSSLKKQADKPEKPLPNRREGKVPPVQTAESKDDPEARKAAGAIRNRANQIADAQGISFSRAWKLAENELAG